MLTDVLIDIAAKSSYPSTIWDEKSKHATTV